MRIDLHTHSNVSDGTDSPTALVRKAQRVELSVVALCDHDTFDGLPEADEAGRRFGVAVLPGIEMSTHVGHVSASDGGVEVHMLGFGVDPWAQPLRGELARMRSARLQRIPRMVERLQALGVKISLDDVHQQMIGASSAGRPHVADALVANGVVANRDEAFASYLDSTAPAYVPRETLELGRAIDLVHDAHGTCIIAHPWIRGTRSVVTAELLARLVAEHELDGIEVDHPDQDQAARQLLFELGGRLGLMRTGGSDYHGSGKIDHDLGTCLTRPSALRELVTRIRTRGGSIGGVEARAARL